MEKNNSGPAGLALDRCLQEIVGTIHVRLGMYAAGVFLLDSEGKELVLGVGAGDDMLLQQINKLRVRPGEGLVGACVDQGRPLVCQDVDKDLRFKRGPLTLTRSEFCAPISIDGRVVGVLDVHDSHKAGFKNDVVAELNELTAALAARLARDRCNNNDGGGGTNGGRGGRMTEGVLEPKLSEDRYRMLVDNLQDPVFILDFNAHVVWANKSTPDYVGLNADQVVGAHVSRFLKKGQLFRLHQLFNDIQEGRIVKNVRMDLSTPAGAKVAEATCAPIADGGRINGCEVLLRDITEKATVERLRKNYLKTLEDEVLRRTQEIKDLQRASILAIATLAESIDSYTWGHLERMRTYAKVIAADLQSWEKFRDFVTDEYVELVYDLSPLHDIGKVGIRDSILMKEDKLTPEEFAKMKEHTEIGANALRMAGRMVHRESLFAMAEMIARFHHQWWDGTGYPAVRVGEESRPLRTEEIPLCARIVALADVYDALTSKRPYKEPYPHEVAKQMILRDSGKHFDPDCVQAFVNREGEFLKIKQQWTDTDPTQTYGERAPLRLSGRDLPVSSSSSGS